MTRNKISQMKLTIEVRYNRVYLCNLNNYYESILHRL